MKITYHVGDIDSLFRKHEPKASLYHADTLIWRDDHCFVYVNDVFVFSYPHDAMWQDYWLKRPRARNNSLMMHQLFERYVRLKLRQLQRTQPSA